MRARSAAILRSDTFISTLGWLLLGAIVGALLLSGLTFWIYVAGLTIIYAISALGLDWIQGRAGQVSIGSAAFMAIGAYAGGVAYTKGVPSILALVIAGFAGAAVGLLVGLPALRLRGLYLALATLSLQFITTALGSAYETSSGQIAGVAVGPPTVGSITLLAGIGSGFFVVLVGLLVLTILVLRRIYRRAPGRAWLAVKESEISAGVMGINPTRWKLSAFVGSSSLIAISGCLLGFYTMRVQSESFTLNFAITFVAMVIVGGLGSIGGIISGAVLITVTPYILSTVASSLPSGLGISNWLQTNVYYINSGLYSSSRGGSPVPRRPFAASSSGLSRALAPQVSPRTKGRQRHRSRATQLPRDLRLGSSGGNRRTTSPARSSSCATFACTARAPARSTAWI